VFIAIHSQTPLKSFETPRHNQSISDGYTHTESANEVNIQFSSPHSVVVTITDGKNESGQSSLLTILPGVSSGNCTASSVSSEGPTKNISVAANDPSIQTFGSDWQNSTSSCDSSLQCKKNKASGQTLKFTFEGTAVYMSTSQSADSGKYSIAVDQQQAIAVDGFVNSTNAVCGLSWNSYGLNDGSHTIVVTTMGQSDKASSVGQDSASAFELDGFIITTGSSASGSIAETFSHVCVLIAILVSFLVNC